MTKPPADSSPPAVFCDQESFEGQGRLRLTGPFTGRERLMHTSRWSGEVLEQSDRSVVPSFRMTRALAWLTAFAVAALALPASSVASSLAADFVVLAGARSAPFTGRERLMQASRCSGAALAQSAMLVEPSLAVT